MARRPDRKVRPFASELMEASVLTEAVLWTVFASNAGVVAAFPWLALHAATLGIPTHWAGESRLQPDRLVDSSRMALSGKVRQAPETRAGRRTHRATSKRPAEPTKRAA